MPEGPEVAKITRTLNKLLKNKQLINITITPSSRYRNKNPEGFNYLITILNNKPLYFTEIKCKGKLIYLIINKNVFIINRLGMSGYWSQYKEKHTSFFIEYKNNPSNVSKFLYFVDVRHFGILKIIYTKKELNNILNKIGPDLLHDNLTFNKYKNILGKHKKKNICRVLMDQTIFSGIGNYLKADILYLTKIHPLSRIENIPINKIKELYEISLKTIRQSFNSNNYNFKVYNRKYDRYNNKIIRIKTPDMRNTYYCPTLQILY